MKISISGPGIAGVDSAELVKTPEAQRQIKAAHGLSKSMQKQVSEIESLRATISRLREYATHMSWCDVVTWINDRNCDCGYDELMKELEESK